MSHVTAHVLDAQLGRPAAGVSVSLLDAAGRPIADAVTDADGRVSSLGPDRLATGTYIVRFGSGDYFTAHDAACFHPYVLVVFDVGAATDPRDGADPEHYHIPLLLSPYSYTTYRGS